MSIQHVTTSGLHKITTTADNFPWIGDPLYEK